MKLSDFKTTGRGKTTRLVTRIADQTGAQDYELRIAGPAALLKRVFAKSDFSVTIDPRRRAEAAKKDLGKYAAAEANDFAQLARLEDVRMLELFKKPAKEPDPAKSVFVSVQRVRGEGTFWVLAFPYFLPTGVDIFLFPPPVLMLGATVTPVSGDQDLFLNRVTGPLLARSRRGGTAPDTVFFTGPLPIPVRVRIVGFARGFGGFQMAAFS